MQIMRSFIVFVAGASLFVASCTAPAPGSGIPQSAAKNPSSGGLPDPSLPPRPGTLQESGGHALISGQPSPTLQVNSMIQFERMVAEYAASSGIAVPSLAQPVDLPPNVQVVLLLGTDNFAPYAGRTDTILLAFLDKNNGSASLISIPRDLYVYLPGRKMDRINTAYVVGGIDLLMLTLEYNLGIRPDHWVLAHLDDFIRLVDDLGGIDVPVSTPLPNDCGSIPLDVVHMDGSTALCYVRSRFSTSDFDRSRRQQEVLQVIFQRFLSLDAVRNLPDWYTRYRDSVHTDLTLPELIDLAPLALRLPEGKIHHFQIGWREVSDWQVPDTGALVLRPQSGQISSLIREAVAVLDSPESTSSSREVRTAESTQSPSPGEVVPMP